MRKTNTPRKCFAACFALAKAYRYAENPLVNETTLLYKERKVNGYRLIMGKLFGQKGRYAFKKISARACRDALKF